MIEFNKLTLFLITAITLVSFKVEARNPTAHWPKKCSDSLNLEQLNQSQYSLKPESLSFHQKQSNPRFMAVVVHGLNLRPERMAALEKLLQDFGGETLRVALLGHRGNIDEQKEVTWNQWLDQFHDHYCYASKRAKKLNIPLVNLSFSLGALVSLGHMANQNEWPYEKLILIAPAAWIHWYGNIPSWFSFLGGRLGLPSKNLESYRAEKTTSLAAYEAMAQGRSEIEAIEETLLKNKTLIVMDPDDELVSLKKIKSFIKEKKLQDSWQTLEISNKNHQLKKSYHHLVVDPPSMGQDSWEALSKRLSSFLTSNNFRQK